MIIMEILRKLSAKEEKVDNNIKYYANDSLYKGEKNKRSSHRINIELNVSCMPYVNIINNEPITIETTSINLSANGMCLKVNNEILGSINTDDFLIIDFMFEDENASILCKCKSISEDKMGIQFIKVIYNSTYAINPTGYITNKLSRFIVGYQLKKKYNSKIHNYKKHIL